jgi:RNA polymerase sigma factor (sigma-70 family)
MSGRVEAMVAANEAKLMTVARQFSLCADDAMDAYQRGLEIYVRRLDSVDPATEVAWLKVVIRNEALAIRRARHASVSAEALEVDTFVPADQRDVEALIARSERSARSAEALRALKPDEARALLMKAQGFSYKEIGERLGWTFTKVNRAITEGRRRFMQTFAAIEAGEACERFAPHLLALAEGRADAAQIVALRPHVKACARCRASVRELRLRRRAAVLIPLPAFLAGWLQRRTVFVGRLQSHDVAVGLQLSASGGGGRVTSLAAVIGVCLSGAGAATYCAATGVPDLAGLLREPPRKEAEKPRDVSAETRRAPARTVAARTATATPTPSPRPAAERSDARRDRAETRRRKPRSTPEDEFGLRAERQRLGWQRTERAGRRGGDHG